MQNRTTTSTVIPLDIGLNKLNEHPMNQLMKNIILLTACGLASFGAIADSSSKSSEGRMAEVHVISLSFQGGGNASMVARPCDKYVTCDNIYARIDEKTVWDDDGQVITYKQARKLNWLAAVLVVDKFNHAQFIRRMITGDE